MNERPDRVSAALAARLQGSRVLIGDETTETTVSYGNPDGTFTTESTSGVARVLQDGKWLPVDSRLVEVGGVFKPRVAKADIEVSAGGAGPFAKLTRSNGESVALSWPSALPKPMVKDNVATFIDAGGPGVDLTVTTSPTSVRHDIVLQTRPTGPVEFKVPISTEGLTLSKTADGRLELAGKSGKIRAWASDPIMWSAGTLGKAGFHSRRGERGTLGAITYKIVVEGDRQVLVLKPDAGFLADPATRYPVTVDPTVVLPINVDTDVNNVWGSSPAGPFMKVGTDTGSEKGRGYLKFDTSGLPTTVTAAKLTLRNMDAPACGTNVSGGIQVRQVTSDWDPNTITWAAQPTNTTTDAVLSKEGSQGYIPGACGSGYMNWDITNIVKKWVTSTANHGLVLQAPVESTTSNYWVYSTSEETVEFNFPPKLAVTYTVPPTVETLSVSPFVAGRTNSLTPALRAQVKDTDGGVLTGEFEVQRGGSTIWIGTATNVAAGSDAQVIIPAGMLANDQQIIWRARAFDGAAYSAYSAWQTLTVDTGVPQPPAISCAGYPSGVWTAKQAGLTTCTLDSPSANVTGYTWQLEDALQNSTVTGDPATISINPAEGWHTLTVRANGAAGTSSSDAVYAFGVGVGEVAKPTQDDRTQTAITLASRAKPDYAAVRYQYRSDLDGGAWIDIPAADVAVPGVPGPIVSWPQTRTDTSKDFADLTWNVAKTLVTRGDGPVEVRACFVGAGETCSTAVRFTLERTAFGSSYTTQSLGPGSVSLLTGDYSLSAVDASAFALSVGRGHTTLAPAIAGVFGPGWKASLPAGSSEVSAMKFADHSADGYLLFTGPDGAQLTYTIQANGTYKGTGDATDGSVVAKNSATQFTHTSTAGVKTIFTLVDSVWNVTSIDEPGTENITTYRYDGQGRVTRILAPVPDGVDCSVTLVVGCRALDVSYASATTATGVGSGWGDFTGQVAAISFTAFEPATSALKTTLMAAYAYDSTGHLRTVTDPRTNLTTTYYYTGEGRVSQVTLPALAPWNIAYDSAGRLAHVSRTSPQGELTQAVVYDLPIGGSGAPIDLTSATTATWAQATDLPRVGAAVFPASRVPVRNGSGVYTPSVDDYPYAALAYMDINGRTVNTASYGAGAWQISVTRYDNAGNTVWDLSPGNRAQALVPTLDTDAVVSGMISSIERANALAELTTYDVEGNVLTTTGPAHRIALASGQVVYSARLRTEYAYDEGAPADRVGAGLLTTTTTKPIILDGTATPGAADTQTVKTGYDTIVTGDTTGWHLYLATSQTRIMSGSADIVHKTRYDSAGRQIERRMPASSGADAGTTVASYYTAGTNSVAACGNKPQWAGMLCRTAPAAQPTGKALPITTITYGYYGQVAQSIEDNGTAVRTTTVTPDTAGRQAAKAISVSPAAAGGTALPNVTYIYDAATGLPTKVSTSTQSITTGYDSLGRVTSQTDATGNIATTVYDAAGRVASVADGKGTTSYGYDGNDADGRAERRGLPTSLTADTHIFNGSYDADGQLVTQVYPGGLTASSRYNTAGQRTKLSYTRNFSPWLDYTLNYDVAGRVAGQTSPLGDQAFGYDGASRLTKVADTYAGSCTTRVYGFSVNANRTSLTTYPAAADKSCSTTTMPAVRSHAYDTADRIIDIGYVYDDFGRTTQVPGSQTTGTDLTVGYFANDMVAKLAQASTSKTFTLDPLSRVTSATISGQFASGTSTNHYADTGDSPAWISEAGGTWTRNIAGFTGLAATLASSGTLTLHLTNPHGDVIATAERLGSGVNAYFEQTEYGTPRSGNTTNPTRYGWLGGAQRSGDAMAGLVLMGVRLYNPTTGRFLQVDPVRGGSCNSYEYVCADPVNLLDLSGTQLKARIQHSCTPENCVGIRRVCDWGTKRCSLDWWITYRKKIRNAYFPAGWEWVIAISGVRVKSGSYSHGEWGDYRFHGHWFSNDGSRGRGWFRCYTWTCYLDPGDTVTITASGVFTLYGRSYAFSVGRVFGGGGHYS